jgi:hypothetical protein
MIFIHVDQGHLAFSVAGDHSPGCDTFILEGMDWRIPYAVLTLLDLETQSGPYLRLLQRIREGQTVWLQEWPSHPAYGLQVSPWAFLLDECGTGQVGVLDALCRLYDANVAEIIEIVAQDADAGDCVPATMQLEFDTGARGLTPIDRAEDIGWRFRANVLGWALKNYHVGTHPVSHAMGYRESVMRRMEPAGVPWTPESPPQHIDALQAVRFFVDHVDVAVRCALDTPQPVTLDLSMGKLTFENVRITKAVRGLRVTLPTGGALFYREASLLPGSGEVMLKSRKVPRRRIPMDIAYQLAADVVHMQRDHGLNNPSEHPPHLVEKYADWMRSSPL